MQALSTLPMLTKSEGPSEDSFCTLRLLYILGHWLADGLSWHLQRPEGAEAHGHATWQKSYMRGHEQSVWYVCSVEHHTVIVKAPQVGSRRGSTAPQPTHCAAPAAAQSCWAQTWINLQGVDSTQETKACWARSVDRAHRRQARHEAECGTGAECVLCKSWSTYIRSCVGKGGWGKAVSCTS